jgi:hypothetical protein
MFLLKQLLQQHFIWGSFISEIRLARLIFVLPTMYLVILYLEL